MIRQLIFIKILKSGEISKMSRHAIHVHADPQMAWKSAVRWEKEPVLLKIAARKMANEGFNFGRIENCEWYLESVPVQ